MFRMSPETRAARAELRRARQALAEESRTSTEETPAFLAANSWVIAAEQRLPWWKRLDIELAS